MVQIIPQRQRLGSSKNEKVDQFMNIATQLMGQFGQNQQANQQEQQEIEAGNRLGIDLQGLPPQVRQKAMELAFQEKFSQGGEQRKFSKEQDLIKLRQQEALDKQKSLADYKMGQKKSFLDQVFGGGKSQQAQERGAPFKSQEQQQQQQQTEQGFNALEIPDEAIARATAIDPPLGHAMRAAKDTALKEQRETKRVAKEEEKMDYQSFKDNKEYTEKVLGGLEAYKRDKMVLDQMDKISSKGNLPKPLAVSLLNKLGIPLGTLENADAEQFDKLSQELMKNIQGTYGSRILQTEVQNFMRSIPTLMNSSEGQKKLINQWKILNEGKKIYYDAYKEIRKQNPKRLPPDLHEQVLESAESKLDLLADQFNKMNEEPSEGPVESGTKITPNVAFKYLRKADGNKEKAQQMAKKDGYVF